MRKDKNQISMQEEIENLQTLMEKVLNVEPGEIKLQKHILMCEVKTAGATGFYVTMGALDEEGEARTLHEWEELGLVSFWHKQSQKTEFEGYRHTNNDGPEALNELLRRLKLKGEL